MIVDVAAVNAHLGFDDTDTDRDTLLTRFLVQVESAFLSATGRQDRPFAAANGETPITEIHDGTGTAFLFTNQAIASITSIVIGRNPALPEETVDLSDVLVTAGTNMIRRSDGGTFGVLDALGVVHVTYTTAVDAPLDVQLAITRAAAALYLQRGAEDVRAESEGGVRSELASPFDDLTWRDAVAAHRELRVG